ncbi:response regulator [Labilibaculum sp.]|uniref:response regulator n=1 Tax=Labilibaculum sp. TaxID=2060723 RepID=UPI00356B0FC7
MKIQFEKFKDWKIKTKLFLLTIITLLSILFLSLTSSYFFNTSRTLNVMINGVRVHQTLLQNSVENLYQFKITKDSVYLKKSAAHLNKANCLIEDMLKLEKDYETKSTAEIATYLYNGAPEAYNNDINNAKLMVSRLKLLNRFRSKNLSGARVNVRKAFTVIDDIEEELLSNGENIDIDIIQDKLNIIQQHYSNISNEVNNLSHKINSALIYIILGIAFILTLSILILSRYIYKSISIPVNQIVENFKLIALGNYHAPLNIDSKDEIGNLARSFNTIQHDFQNVVDHTSKIAKGDLSTNLVLKSKDDELSISINKMIETLKDSKAKNDDTLWFRSSINKLNTILQGDQNLENVTNKSLIFINELLNVQLGAIYIYHKDSEILELSASIGMPTSEESRHIPIGYGLVGQAAKTKNINHFTDVPTDYFTIFSASGKMKPKNIMLIPLIYNHKIRGVMELATINTLNETEISFIEAIRESMAVKISSTLARTQLETLLTKTQEQTNELQVQQEELRIANAELAEQTKTLIDNESKLQVQQEELRVANEELEERTNQLEIQKEEIQNKNLNLSQTHDKLETKARELEQTSQYKSDFLANMSHELRTPLNSLLILSGLLAKNKKGNLTPDDIESVEIINKSGEDLLQLINEILDLSKIEAGKMAVEFENIHIENIANNILINFKHQAEKKKLDFKVEIAPNFPKTIETDQLRISQILKNLLSNAFKFTSQGSITVSMKMLTNKENLQREDLKGAEVCAFMVTDTGVGIPDEKKEAIFEAFQQADGSTTRKYGGTGLGLSISKELARLLGGEIHLESEANNGSTFTLFLPVLQEGSTKSEPKTEIGKNENMDEKPAISPKFINDDRDIPQTKPTVVIIHPDKKEANQLHSQIRDNQFNALAASNTKDAIALIENHQASAIIIALALLSKNGESELKLLKSHSLASKLPIHVVNPIEGLGDVEVGELPTVNTTDFNTAIKQIQKDLLSDYKKILIIEDDPVTQKILTNLLKPTNAIIEQVTNGHNAIQLIKKNNYNCIVLDLGLPDITGHELLDKLTEENIKIPNTIIYTGKDLDSNEHRELSKFTNSIILKGLKSDERLMDEVTLFLHQVATKIPESPKVSATEIDDSIFKGKKILVVDDEIRNIFALGKILEDKEIDVLEAENGKIALDVLNENPNVDLVLMDIMMPEMNGYEAMTLIRETPKIKEIPIICLTAKAMKGDCEKAIASGANDYLAKPIDENKLFSMLKIWLYN